MITAKSKLPSRCLFYGEGLKDIEVEYRAMNSNDIEMMLKPEKDRYSKILEVVKSCVLTKELDVNKLLVSDEIALLFFIRTLTYGAEYNVQFSCECGEKSSTKINLAKDLPINFLDDDAQEIEEIEFENGKVYGLRRMTVADQDDIVNRRKSRLNSGQQDDSFTYRLAKSIVTIDGKEVNILEALKEFPMSANDSLSLQQALDDIDCGIQLEITNTCKFCGNKITENLNLDQEFFRPRTVSYKKRRHS